jgi:hypothetical protein
LDLDGKLGSFRNTGLQAAGAQNWLRFVVQDYITAGAGIYSVREDLCVSGHAALTVARGGRDIRGAMWEVAV